MLYSATLPSYENAKKDREEKGGKHHNDDVIKADDPRNRESVLAVIRGHKF